jgi:hypothetical protein
MEHVNIKCIQELIVGNMTISLLLLPLVSEFLLKLSYGDVKIQVVMAQEGCGRGAAIKKFPLEISFKLCFAEMVTCIEWVDGEESGFLNHRQKWWPAKMAKSGFCHSW